MEKADGQRDLRLATFLLEEMKKRKLSHTALARSIGVSLQTMNMYLEGQRPSLENCRRLSVFLNVPLAKIISLVHPDVLEKQIISLLELYLDLTDEGRSMLEEVALAIHKMKGKSKDVP